MQILGRSDEPISLRDAGKEIWRWRYVASWFVVFWVALKVVEFYIMLRRVPTFIEDGHDGEVAEQSAPVAATE